MKTLVSNIIIIIIISLVSLSSCGTIMAQSRYSRYSDPAPRRSYRAVEPRRSEYRSERVSSYNREPTCWEDRGNNLWIFSTSNPVLYVVENAYGKQSEYGLRTWKQALRTMPEGIIEILDYRPAFKGIYNGLVWKVKCFTNAGMVEYHVTPTGSWS